MSLLEDDMYACGKFEVNALPNDPEQVRELEKTMSEEARILRRIKKR